MTERTDAPAVAPEPLPDQPPTAPSARAEWSSERRDEMARAKGLPGSTIVGGGDPRLDETVERERPWVIALLVMVVVLVLAGFVLGILGAAIDSFVRP